MANLSINQADKKIIPHLQLHAFEGKDAFSWRDYLVEEQPPEIKPLLHINNIPVWSPENHSLIIGKKKSRKTLFIVWLIAAYIKQGGSIEDVLICDTEQGKKHVWKVRDKIYRMTAKHVNILSLRGLSVSKRRDVVRQAVEESSFKVVVIDGIRDLLGNINDPDQCTDLITFVENLTVTFNLHIVNILHQNKTDNNARGHLGTELLNKAEITIELELDENAGCTVVKCESSRDVPFESFAFTHSIDELPELVNMPNMGVILSDKEEKQRLQYVFEDGLLKYQQVIDGLKMHMDLPKNKAEILLGKFIRKGWIVKNGKDRSPNVLYKLMISSGDSTYYGLKIHRFKYN